jgi:hypothetical protein
MNYSITLTCEYIFDQDECITYLSIINVNPKQYEYVYNDHDVLLVTKKKLIRKLIDIYSFDLLGYSNVMKITFYADFNKDISHLPLSLTRVIFGRHFNKDISRLSDTLIYLELGGLYNTEIKKLPRLLRYLTIGYHYRQKLCDLPDKLIYLNICSISYKFPELPCSIRYLTIGSNCLSIPSQFPMRLVSLKWFSSANIPLLNHCLEHLTIGFSFRQTFGSNSHHICELPGKLKTLAWYSMTNIPLGLPLLKKLIIGKAYNGYIPRLRNAIIIFK